MMLVHRSLLLRLSFVSLFVSYPCIPTCVERYRAVSVGTKSPERKLIGPV